MKRFLTLLKKCVHSFLMQTSFDPFYFLFFSSFDPFLRPTISIIPLAISFSQISVLLFVSISASIIIPSFISISVLCLSISVSVVLSSSVCFYLCFYINSFVYFYLCLYVSLYLSLLFWTVSLFISLTQTCFFCLVFQTKIFVHILPSLFSPSFAHSPTQPLSHRYTYTHTHTISQHKHIHKYILPLSLPISLKRLLVSTVPSFIPLYPDITSAVIKVALATQFLPKNFNFCSTFE